jgi:hypothetical protein
MGARDKRLDNTRRYRQKTGRSANDAVKRSERPGQPDVAFQVQP